MTRATYADTGAKSWFRFGTFSFQPSEVVKIFYIFNFGKVATSHNMKTKYKTNHTGLAIIREVDFMGSSSIGTRYFDQNDLGTTLYS